MPFGLSPPAVMQRKEPAPVVRSSSAAEPASRAPLRFLNLPASAETNSPAPDKSPPRLLVFREISQTLPSSSHRNTPSAPAPLPPCSATIPPPQSSTDAPWD